VRVGRWFVTSSVCSASDASTLIVQLVCPLLDGYACPGASLLSLLVHPCDWWCLRCCACRTIEQVSANIECNAVSAVQVTHHFLKRMVSLVTLAMHMTLLPGAVQPLKMCRACCVPLLCLVAAN
jgi:hypothetical protein